MVLDEVLREVNEIRGNCSLPLLSELPKGVPGIPGSCVLARAFKGVVPNVRVGGRYVYTCPGSVWYDAFELGGLLERFVDDFDNGVYPELVEVDGAD